MPNSRTNFLYQNGRLSSDGLTGDKRAPDGPGTIFSSRRQLLAGDGFPQTGPVGNLSASIFIINVYIERVHPDLST